MKKIEDKEPKALLEARAWKARVSREIERKGWKRFRQDARAYTEKWQRKVEALQRSKLAGT